MLFGCFVFCKTYYEYESYKSCNMHKINEDASNVTFKVGTWLFIPCDF